MSRLALGTAQFGLRYGVANRDGQVAPTEIQALLAAARANGIDTLDTAIAYGDAEERLGAAGVEDWLVVSKLPAFPGSVESVEAWVRSAVNESRLRLRIDSLYGLLLHRPQQLLCREGPALYSTLRLMKREGLVRKIGVSVYDPEELDALAGAFAFDLVQAPLNVLDSRFISTGWLERLVSEGVEIHIRSVFLQGLLLLPPEARPRSFDRWADVWTRYDAWIEDSGLTRLEACLRFALSVKQIDRVIVGVDNLRQLREILAAAEGPPPLVPRELYTTDLDLLNPARWRDA